MSKYRLIKTEYRNPESLVKALTDLGVIYTRSDNLRKNEAVLKTNWTGHWGGKDQECAIAIQRADLSKFVFANGKYRTMDGVGFSWNGSAYDLIQDQHDTERPDVIGALNKLNQRYSYHETMRLARMNGYSVKSTTSENGKIRIVVQKVGG